MPGYTFSVSNVLAPFFGTVDWIYGMVQKIYLKLTLNTGVVSKHGSATIIGYLILNWYTCQHGISQKKQTSNMIACKLWQFECLLKEK